MRIKKLNISYGGYSSTHYEVNKHRNRLVFKTWDYHPFENRPVIVKFSSDQLESFVTQMIKIVNHWVPRYDSDICDGTQWTLVLQTDTHKYDIYGSNNFPENFDDLVRLIRCINFEKFADGHLEADEINRDVDSDEAL